MNVVKKSALTSLLVGSILFSGCQAVEDRVGDVLHGRAFPFNQPAQQQQQNYSGNNSGGQQGYSGGNFNSGEVKVNGAFGETYAVTAVNYLGKPGTADIRPNNFINIRSEFESGQRIAVGFRIPNTLTKDVVFRLYNSRGAIENEVLFQQTVTDAGLVHIIAPNSPGNYTYLFSGKTYRNSLFGKSIGEETPIVRGEITIK